VIRRILFAGLLVLQAACAGPAPSVAPSPPTAPTASPSGSAAAAPSSAESSETAIASPSKQAIPPIAGEWVGVHDCQRIVTMLTDAGLDEFLADAVYGNELVPGVSPSTTKIKDPSRPCDGAVQRAHSHFFTADGQFGSKDFHGQQVDDGPYRLEGDDIVVIGDQRFRYKIEGDELTLQPPNVDISGCTTKECRFTATWVLMVAMPGTTWTRGEIPVS
jgi:hypothetical protein